jgi:hypothetical protein
MWLLCWLEDNTLLRAIMGLASSCCLIRMCVACGVWPAFGACACGTAAVYIALLRLRCQRLPADTW